MIFWKFKWRIGYGKYSSLSKINRQWRKWRALTESLVDDQVSVSLVPKTGIVIENHCPVASHQGLRVMVFNALQQYFSYIVEVSFIGGVNQSTRRKPPTFRKSLTNFITMLYRVHLAMGGIQTHNFKFIILTPILWSRLWWPLIRSIRLIWLFVLKDTSR